MICPRNIFAVWTEKCNLSKEFMPFVNVLFNLNNSVKTSRILNWNAKAEFLDFYGNYKFWLIHINLNRKLAEYHFINYRHCLNHPQPHPIIYIYIYMCVCVCEVKLNFDLNRALKKFNTNRNETCNFVVVFIIVE